MIVFNWDRMPPELRYKLLELADMDTALESVKWNGFLAEERKNLREALLSKTDGTATIGSSNE